METAFNIEFNTVAVAMRDTINLCQELASLRAIVLGFSSELTLLLRLRDDEEFSHFEINKLRPFLDRCTNLKEQYFKEIFYEIFQYDSSLNITSMNPDVALIGQDEAQVVQYYDLFREFLGIFCCALQIAAECTARREEYKEASLLYEKVIQVMTQSGCHLNTEGQNDGKAIELNRMKARLASSLFSAGYIKKSAIVCEEAMKELGAFLDHKDPDIQTLLSLSAFINATDVLYKCDYNARKYKYPKLPSSMSMTK
jgi:hypothetical protein